MGRFKTIYTDIEELVQQFSKTKIEKDILLWCINQHLKGQRGLRQMPRKAQAIVLEWEAMNK